MRPLGFSTGAIAPGNLIVALEVLRYTDARAIELSALRMVELEPLVAMFDRLPLSRYTHIAIHAPIDMTPIDEPWAIQLLQRLSPRVHQIVVHPDAITASQWSVFGNRLSVENMDRRKRTGRTAEELEQVFKCLPWATLCIDLAHARQVDPSMIETHRIVTQFSARIRQIHVSELSADGRHARMSATTRLIYNVIARFLPAFAPAILEAPVTEPWLDRELSYAAHALTPEPLKDAAPVP